MNSDEFATNIVAPLEQKMFPTGRRPHAKQLTVHLNNCSIHMHVTTEVYISEDNLIRLKYHSDSPDLAPSDFCLFPTAKEKLKHIQMIDEEDSFDRLQELLSGISCKELDKVLGTWINRLMIISQGDGAYLS
jgi:hypothetical protein